MDHTLITSPSRSMVQAVAGSTIALTIVLVTAHIVSRRIARASIWWDDGLLWFGSGITLVMNALFIHGAQLGLGCHEDQVSSSQLEAIFKVLFTNNLLHLWAMAAIKTSLLLFFHRMFASSNNTLRWTVYFSICLLFIWVVVFTAISIFQCTPISLFWDTGIAGGKCITSNWTSRTAIAICDAVFNVSTDFLCLLAPFQVLRRLQMANGKKAGLAAVYLLGGCTVVITVIRLLYQIDNPALVSSDSLYAAFIPTVFLIIETNLAVACACMPFFTVMDGRAIFFKTAGSSTTTTTFTAMPKTSNSYEASVSSNYTRSYQQQQQYQHSTTSLILTDYKRQQNQQNITIDLSPITLSPTINTTISSSSSTSSSKKDQAIRLPSLELGSFAQSSVFDILKPAGAIIKTFDVEQVVEQESEAKFGLQLLAGEDENGVLNVEQSIEEYDAIMKQAHFSQYDVFGMKNAYFSVV